MTEEKNNGIILRDPSPRAWLSGMVTGLPGAELLPAGDWRAFLPGFEPQYKPHAYDTAGCVSFSANNTLEILHKFRYGEEVNLSDRYLAKRSGTTQQGNWFENVWQAIRHDGFVPEETWPFEGNTWPEYMAPIPDVVVGQGQAALELYDVGYEFLPVVTDDALRAGLRKAPLQIAIGSGDVATHAVALVAQEWGSRRWIFDTYPGGGSQPGLVPIPWERRIFAALRPHFIKKGMPNNPLNLPNDCLVFALWGGGTFALHVAGKMYVDDLAKIEGQWLVRNEDQATHRFAGGPVRTLSAADFEKYPRFNLKDEPLP